MTARRNSTKDRRVCLAEHGFEHGGRQKLICHRCKRWLTVGIDEWDADHWPIAFSLGGTEVHPICKPCHAVKTATSDVPILAKGKRKGEKLSGVRKRGTGRPIPGSKASGWKKRLDGTVIRRS